MTEKESNVNIEEENLFQENINTIINNLSLLVKDFESKWEEIENNKKLKAFTPIMQTTQSNNNKSISIDLKIEKPNYESLMHKDDREFQNFIFGKYSDFEQMKPENKQENAEQNFINSINNYKFIAPSYSLEDSFMHPIHTRKRSFLTNNNNSPKTTRIIKNEINNNMDQLKKLSEKTPKTQRNKINDIINIIKETNNNCYSTTSYRYNARLKNDNKVKNKDEFSSINDFTELNKKLGYKENEEKKKTFLVDENNKEQPIKAKNNLSADSPYFLLFAERNSKMNQRKSQDKPKIIHNKNSYSYNYNNNLNSCNNNLNVCNNNTSMNSSRLKNKILEKIKKMNLK